MQTNNPVLLAELNHELAAVHAEVQALVVGLQGCRAKGETLERVLYLRARFNALRITLRSFEMEYMSCEVAFQERTGTAFDEERDEFTAADETRARQILSIFGLNLGDQ